MESRLKYSIVFPLYPAVSEILKQKIEVFYVF